MQFASIPYLVFLALAVAVYFALPRPWMRAVWLLLASYTFYYTLSAAWTLALAGITVIGYVIGLLLERAGPAAGDVPMNRSARTLLALGVVLVAGTLCVFKYTGFAADLVNRGLALAGAGAALPILKLALPVGISFWTFTSIAYLVDVASGKQAAERNLVRYAVFVSFFPHVMSGPIPRGGQLLPQLSERHRFKYERMRSALLLVLWGFFKKLVVADPLGVFVNQVYRRPMDSGADGLLFAAATVAFAIQIYCDFSGYTDVARGSARLFGVDLLPNFHRPYEARSVKEFWRRWHMSLMSWLRDYVYIPLGGSRVSKLARYRNMLVVFFLSGLWHGAGLKFIVWGLLNGVYQILGEWLRPLRRRIVGALPVAEDGRLVRAAQTILTFGLICIAWVFFRASSLSDALYIVSRMFSPTLDVIREGLPFKLALAKPQVVAVALATVIVFGVEHVAGRIDLPRLVFRQPLPIRWALYQAAILATIVFGYYGQVYNAGEFVYFNF